MCDSVPSTRYSSVCNVLRQWNISLIPTYRVYRLYDKEIEKGEIAKCVRKLKNNKTGGSDGIVGELLKYDGSGMVDLLEQLFSVIWQEEIVLRQ